MKNKLFICFTILFISINFILGIQTIFNHNEYSVLEQRDLQRFEEVSSLSPLTKEFYTSLTDSFADQFNYRNEFISQYFYLNTHILNQKYINDVVVGKDENLFGEPFELNDNIDGDITKIANLVNQQANELKKYNTKLIYISYTRKDGIMTDYLPSFYNNYHDRFIDYNKKLKSLLNENVIFVDMLDLLENDKFYYYRGDHHLNIEGQEIVFNYLNKIMIENKNPLYSLSDYQIVESYAEGSYDRKIAYQSSQVKENLYLFPKNFKYNYKRYEDNKLSDLPIMAENEKYACFMSGDRGKTKIDNLDSKSDFRILFSGSSFLNSLEYLYIPSVSSFVSIDYRHNKENKTLTEYVKEFQPQYVIYTASSSNSCYDFDNHKLHFGLDDEDNGE